MQIESVGGRVGVSSIRVVAANADYFAAVCLDGCHVSGLGRYQMRKAQAACSCYFVEYYISSRLLNVGRGWCGRLRITF